VPTGSRKVPRRGPLVLEIERFDMTRGGINADLFAMNTRGNVDFFDLENARMTAFDVPVLNTPAARRGIVNSLFLATAAASILVLVTALISYLNVKARLRGAGLLDMAGLIPFALPGSVIGVAMILAWSNPPIGPTLYGTIWILLVAYIMRYMAFGLQSTRATLQQIHSSLEEAALTAGAGRLPHWAGNGRGVIMIG
jgi:ABC-type Fe3+ transport system permease subunit